MHAPYSSLESVIEQNKEAYYLALRQTQGTLRNEQPVSPPPVFPNKLCIPGDARYLCAIRCATRS